MISNARFKEFIKIPKNYRPDDGIFVKYKTSLISAVRNSEKQTSGAIKITADTEIGQDFIDLFAPAYLYAGILLNRVASGTKMKLETDDDGIIKTVTSNNGDITPKKYSSQYNEIITEYKKYFIHDNYEPILSLNGEKMINEFKKDNCINIAEIYDLSNIGLSLLLVTDKLFSSVYPMIKKDLIKDSQIDIYDYKNNSRVKLVVYKFTINNFIITQTHAAITRMEVY